ncbi:hypothetical protein [Streptomyces lydicus]
MALQPEAVIVQATRGPYRRGGGGGEEVTVFRALTTALAPELRPLIAR